MSAAALLVKLRGVGASFRADGGELVVRAPPGRLAAADVEELQRHKPALLALLAGDRCRTCEKDIPWRQANCVAFGDGTSAHLGCYEEAEVAHLLAAGRRAVESADALEDPAEVCLRGEIG